MSRSLVKLVMGVSAALLIFLLPACLILSPECRSFYNLPVEQREATFKSYPIEKQVNVYECGREREPPDLELALFIAHEGPENIPYLMKRLREETFDPDKVDIIYIFQLMGGSGHLKGRRDVVEQIERVISTMRFEKYKEDAKGMLEEIKRDVG